MKKTMKKPMTKTPTKTMKTTTATPSKTPKTTTTPAATLAATPAHAEPTSDATGLDIDKLNYDLLQAQAKLREQRDQPQSRGVLILVNGMEESGKGDAVKSLSEWLDARYIKVHATLGQNPSEHQPIWQRHTHQLPRHGEIAIYFGNWYADLIRYYFDHIDDLDHQRLSQMMADIEAFEQDLIANHTNIVKCWFSIDDNTLKQRLKNEPANTASLYHLDWSKAKQRKQFKQFSEHLMDKQPGWHPLCGNDTDVSSQQFAQLVLTELQQVNQHMADAKPPAKDKPPAVDNHDTFKLAAIPATLTNPSTHVLDKTQYKQQLDPLQRKLAKLLAKRGQRHVVMVFEGMDAAGKGGAIKRLIAELDPREYSIHPISAPSEDELKHPYLWRFWTRLPYDELADVDLAPIRLQHPKVYKRFLKHVHDSRIAIFDRSWYGRVLVERIEGFAQPKEWQRAYAEIKRFEQDLTQSGGIVLKFWLAISSDEELKRFNARKDTSHKQYKITDEDWRNRSQWDAYVQAASDMIAHTHTHDCPWHIIASDDKRQARIQVLQAAIDQLAKRL